MRSTLHLATDSTLMSLETASYIHQLDAANPSGTDRLAQGDDHIRLLKAALKATFPEIKGPVGVSHTFLNGLAGLLIPVGSIVMWSTSVAPAGWAICNGQTVARSDGSGNITTPDLRNRVPVGASDTHAVTSTFGSGAAVATTSSAGGHSHGVGVEAAGGHSHGGAVSGTALSAAQMPAHDHKMVAIERTGSDIATSPTSAIANRGSYGGDNEYTLTVAAGEPTAGRVSSAGSGAAHGHAIGTDGGHTHNAWTSEQPGHTHSLTVDPHQPSIALNFIMKI